MWCVGKLSEVSFSAFIFNFVYGNNFVCAGKENLSPVKEETNSLSVHSYSKSINIT